MSMAKRIWVIVAVFLSVGVTAFIVQSMIPCSVHRLYINGRSISMLESPTAALLSMTDYPVLMDENQLNLSCEGGVLAHNIQLYIRLAYEKDGTIHFSPNATVYNFSSTKNDATLSMNDILSLDESSNYNLVLFESITYRKAAASIFQYAIFPLDCPLDSIP